ncbi:MAG: riboflavin biosynthesis protein RibF [Dysgonamonadaceae bacterium]|nr:riboflavin biosynthesis protein RibF [Dysgonamonadaceae bacterium]
MTTIFPDNLSPTSLPPGVAGTIGFFDGVHEGHRFLIEQLKKIAGEKGLFSAVVTFSVHPRRILNKGFCPELLNSFEEKLFHLSATGIDYCYVLNFTEDLSNRTACEFIQQELYQKLNVRCLLTGYDHRFGKNREEGFSAYKQYGAAVGMDIVEVAPMFCENINVSSTKIRKLLSEGEIERANRLLSYPYMLKGIVVEGNRIGRTIGFPTANIRLSDKEKMIPGAGVYAVVVHFDQTSSYKAMLYIGRRPTVNGSGELRIEVHMPDFSGDLYGKTLEIRLIRFLRNDMKFDSIDALKQQLETDKEAILK